MEQPTDKDPFLDDDRVPGERLKGESDKAFKAFAAYRDMEPHARSVLAVYRHITGRAQAAAAPGTWQAWCAENHWVERAEEWDEYLDEQRRAEQVKAARAAAKRHAQLAEGLTTIALGEVTKLANQVVRDLDPSHPDHERNKTRNRLPAKELAKVAAIAVKLQRLVAGEPTSIEQLNAEVEMTYTDLIMEAQKAAKAGR